MPKSPRWSAIAAGSIALLSLFALAAPRIAYKAPKSTNAVPTAAITSPAAGSHFALGKSVAIAATANDSDGSVVRVDF